MNFKTPISREQTIIFNSIDDMIDKDNAVRIIDLFIEKFISDNPNEFISSKNSNYGASSYHPSTMLKLFFYGYLNRIKSSRQLETETYRNLELIWLVGNLHPDHWTISTFRKDKGDKIKKVWKYFQVFLKSSNYIDLKCVGIDGTKVKANTRRDMLTTEKLKKMIELTEAKMGEYLENLENQDHFDNHQEEIDDAVSNALEESRLIQDEMLEKISKLEAKLEEYIAQLKYMESNGLKRLAISDPGVRLVRSREGKIPGYNIQTVVDSKHHMIAEIEETREENDLHQLVPMIEKVKATYNEHPKVATLDTGYFVPDSIEKVSKLDIDVYVAQKKDKEDISFTYNSEKDIYICSEGKELHLFSRNKMKRNSLADIYRCKDCQGCPQFGKCTNSTKGRTLSRYKNQAFRDAYKEKMKNKKAKYMMRLRKSLVEHPFGTIKYLMGRTPLLLRGLEKISVEIKLYALAYNFKRLLQVSSFDTIVNQIATFSFGK